MDKHPRNLFSIHEIDVFFAIQSHHVQLEFIACGTARQNIKTGVFQKVEAIEDLHMLLPNS